MGWREEQEAKQKKIKNELDTLMIHYTQEELEKRFLKRFGCINFRNEDFYHELELAREFHKRHQELHPEMHEIHEYDKYRCYHVIECKCGFNEECDSSD